MPLIIWSALFSFLFMTWCCICDGLLVLWTAVCEFVVGYTYKTVYKVKIQTLGEPSKGPRSAWYAPPAQSLLVFYFTIFFFCSYQGDNKISASLFSRRVAKRWSLFRFFFGRDWFIGIISSLNSAAGWRVRRIRLERADSIVGVKISSLSEISKGGGRPWCR